MSKSIAALGPVLVIAFATPSGVLAASSEGRGEACKKTVTAMGAPMRQADAAGPNGEPALRYVVRTNGVDYDVVCAIESGMVTDVALHRAAEGAEQ